MRVIGSLFLLALPGPSAWAAPWVAEQGSWYVRGAAAREVVEGLDAWRADVYGEYGLTPDWTLSAKVEGVAYDDASDFNAQGWRATARRKVFQRGSLVGSLEFGALQGAAIGGANGCDTFGGEFRGGLAWSGQVRQIDAFAFAEVAQRRHDDCRRDRLELGVGQRVTQNVWTVTQVWLERGTQNAESDKLQTELMWRAGAFDASFGYRQENGRVFDESGIFIALAKRF